MPGLDGERPYRFASATSSDLAKKMVFVTGDTSGVSTRDFLEATLNLVFSKSSDMSGIRHLIESFP